MITITKEMCLFALIVYIGTILFDVFCFKWLEKHERLERAYSCIVGICVLPVPVVSILISPVFKNCVLFLFYCMIFGYCSLGAIATVTYFQERRDRKNTFEEKAKE